jgi:hypothetical protein
MKCSIIIFFWSISFTAFAGGVFNCPNIEELEGLSKQGGVKLENLNPDARIRDIPADKSFFYFFDNFKNSKGDLTCFYENFPNLKQDINNLKINDLIKINENIKLITSNQERECYSKEISNYTGRVSWSRDAEKIHLLFKEFLDLHNKLNLPLQEVLKTCRPLTKDKEVLTCMDLLESRLNVNASPHGGMGFKIPDTQFYQDNDFFTDQEKLPPILKNESTVDFFNNLTSESMTKTESINKLKEIQKDLEKDFKNVKTVSFSENSVGMHNPSNRLVISYEDKNCLYTYISAQKNFLGISLLGRHIHCWNDPQTGSKLETPIQYLMDFTIDDNKNYAPRKQTERCIDCHTRGPILFMSDKINHGKQEEVDELNHRLKQLPPAQWVTWDKAEKKYVDAFLAPRYRASQVYGPMFKYDDPKIDQMIKNAIPETDQMNLSEKEIIDAVKNSASCSECHNPNFLGPLV